MAFSDSIIASSSSTLNNTLELGGTEPFNASYMFVAYNEGTTQAYNMIHSPSSDNMDGFRIKHLEKCEEVRGLINKVEDPLESMIMIDVLQRLGIDYHFEEEIKTLLGRQYRSLSSGGGSSANGNLQEVALGFRLLRQAGYCVPTDVFGNFKDNKGKFKLELSEDIRGMMSLYEASHLGIEGEDILDEASDFAGKHLNASMTILEPDLAKVVGDTLEHPCHKSLARFKAKHFLNNLYDTYGWISLLQELAKMDFNIVQSLHQRELLQVSKWWKDLGLAQELKFIRDQPLKWYMWSMVVITDPKFSQQRIELTKPISLVYVIDDIFDVHGTLDELVIFTEAIKKWDLLDIEQLPNYMKICFKALDGITNDIADKVLREHGWNPAESLRKVWASLCDAFLVEAKWFASEQVPKAVEYLRNGVVSSGVHVVLVHLFFLLGQGLTKESVDSVEHIPGLISYPATILRLWDDLGSAKDENQEGFDGSYIECYMKERGSSSIESAQEHVFFMISDSWKRLNQECLSSNPFSPSFKTASLNAARMVRVMYSYDENQRLPALEEYINTLLYKSIPL